MLLLTETRKKWLAKGIAPEDFLVLTLFVLGLTRSAFYRQTVWEQSPEQQRKLEALLARRSQYEPVAYLTGSKEFFGRNFIVTPATLIPRPDSECLIEDVLSFRANSQKPDYILDIGTGSGALIITLASELAKAAIRFFGSDVSSEALIVAERNKKLHESPVTFLEGSFLTPYKKIIAIGEGPQYVYIIANLPYVSEEIFSNTAPDVQKYEPKQALISGDAGLAHYKEFLTELTNFPHTITGTAWLEISPEQSNFLAEKIKCILPATKIFTGQDLSGRDRFIRFSF